MVERSYLIFEMVAIILCIHGLYGEKFRWNIYTILYLSIEFISYQLRYVYGNIPGWKIAVYILLFVYIRIQFKGPWAIAIINYVLSIVMSSVIQLVCYYPLGMLHVKDTMLINFCVNITLFVLMFIFYRTKLLNKIALYMQQKGRMVFGVLIMLVSFSIVAIYSFSVNKGLEVLDYYLLIGSIILVFILLYYLQKERMLNQNMLIEKNLNNLYGNALSELIERVRMNQHDYKNQLTTIQGLAYTAQDINELRIEQEKYYKIIENEDKYYKIISGNNDPVIAGFLYSKLCNVNTEEIQIDYLLKVDKIENILFTSDVIKILGILIDNAFEEIKKNEYKKKRVDIEITELTFLKIRVGNICHFMSISEMEKCFKKGHSNKGDGRGLGLYNVSEIVRRWKGMILPENVEKDGENWFYVTVEFPQ